jgi:hypothetical protein
MTVFSTQAARARTKPKTAAAPKSFRQNTPQTEASPFFATIVNLLVRESAAVKRQPHIARAGRQARHKAAAAFSHIPAENQAVYVSIRRRPPYAAAPPDLQANLCPGALSFY